MRVDHRERQLLSCIPALSPIVTVYVQIISYCRMSLSMDFGCMWDVNNFATRSHDHIRLVRPVIDWSRFDHGYREKTTNSLSRMGIIQIGEINTYISPFARTLFWD